MENATKVVVDESVVNGENKPYIMYESDESRGLSQGTSAAR
jgi:ATP-dependent Clp protease ATP-binding subunit ClpX